MSVKPGSDPLVRSNLAEAAPVFAALGDATRLGLISRLSASGPMSIARLAAGTSVSRQAVTKHLHVLAEAQLARGSRLGRETIWQLEAGRLEDARACIDHISAQWDQALNRLQLLLDHDDEPSVPH
jgi:DNA-binding transcriptional ArsR family regulator